MLNLRHKFSYGEEAWQHRAKGLFVKGVVHRSISNTKRAGCIALSVSSGCLWITNGNTRKRTRNFADMFFAKSAPLNSVQKDQDVSRSALPVMLNTCGNTQQRTKSATAAMLKPTENGLVTSIDNGASIAVKISSPACHLKNSKHLEKRNAINLPELPQNCVSKCSPLTVGTSVRAAVKQNLCSSLSTISTMTAAKCAEKVSTVEEVLRFISTFVRTIFLTGSKSYV